VASARREAIDPAGRRVVFDERTEGHLVRRRPQMLRHVDAILDAIGRLMSTRTMWRQAGSASIAATWIRGDGCGWS
jgi:hypothetical protein